MTAKPPNMVQCPGCEETYDASDPAQVQAHAPHLEIWSDRRDPFTDVARRSRKVPLRRACL